MKVSTVQNVAGKTVVVYNTAGQVVEYDQLALDKNASEINLCTRAEGVYFVKVSDKNGKVLQSARIVAKH